jgi:hypothetical protein
MSLISLLRAMAISKALMNMFRPIVCYSSCNITGTEQYYGTLFVFYKATFHRLLQQICPKRERELVSSFCLMVKPGPKKKVGYLSGLLLWF